VLSVLLMPAMIIRSWQGYIQMLLIDFPLFVASTMSVVDVLLGQPEGTLSEDLVQADCVRAVPDGVGRSRADHLECGGGDRGSDWQEVGVCAYAEVSREAEGRGVAG